MSASTYRRYRLTELTTDPALQEAAAARETEIRAMYPELSVLGHEPRLYRRAEPAAATPAELRAALQSGRPGATDLRIIIKAEEELSQTSAFQRLFPTAETAGLVALLLLF